MNNTGEQERDWEHRLYQLLGEIELAKGEQGPGVADDGLEARVRIAWERAYEEAQQGA
jgi:hypothetical protein